MAIANTNSPLRQRFIDDMSLRKLAPKTQSSYILAVKKLALFLGRSPHTATLEDMRRFQLQRVNDGISLARYPFTTASIDWSIIGTGFNFKRV